MIDVGNLQERIPRLPNNLGFRCANLVILNIMCKSVFCIICKIFFVDVRNRAKKINNY